MGWAPREALVRHLEDADFVGRPEAVLHRTQDAEVVAAFALEIKHGVDHVLDDVDRRSGLLVTWPTSTIAALGSRSDHRLRGAPVTCRAPNQHVVSVWIESRMTRSGRLPSAMVARMSSTLVSAASSTGVGNAEPLRAAA